MSCLQLIPALSDHPLVSVSKQFLWRELESCQLKYRHTIKLSDTKQSPQPGLVSDNVP